MLLQFSRNIAQSGKHDLLNEIILTAIYINRHNLWLNLVACISWNHITLSKMILLVRSVLCKLKQLKCTLKNTLQKRINGIVRFISKIKFWITSISSNSFGIVGSCNSLVVAKCNLLFSHYLLILGLGGKTNLLAYLKHRAKGNIFYLQSKDKLTKCILGLTRSVHKSTIFLTANR